jgi:hypothetical protein
MDETEVKPQCPLCRQTTLGKHCTNRGCPWLHCTNKDCDAHLDPKYGRGHRRHPEGNMVKGTVVRTRVKSVCGQWHNVPEDI